ncbi:non-canonical purine NTP pyrophosphatase [Helicobacter cinaedi]|uniref:non-canonical purine NTP pyrophosphatase n=1 Tax=Helicobacter cinaedi TaxID=213 RepID=UPI001F1CA9DF|nr:non-canonical purine NTP pyrophosphatase [Helicobacter cinaedi]BDB66692.1 non-canonical purine NTP pyrophosphatase [Helicobacter cinaedi]
MTIILATGNNNKIREFKAILQEQIQHLPNKTLRDSIQDSINVCAYSDFVSPFEIEENGTSFKENATIKLKAVYNAFCNKMRDDMEVRDSVWNGLHTPLVFIAEDSGLSVPMLDNEPGIYSARYYEFLQAQGQIQKSAVKLSNSADEVNLVCLCEKLSGLVNKGQIQIPAFFTAYIALLIVPISATLDSMLPPFECLEVEYSEGVLHGEVIDKPRGKEGFGYDPIFIPTQSNPQKQTLAEFSLSAKNAISHRKKAFSQCIKKLFSL